MLTILYLFAIIIGGYLLGDLFSGIFHFYEDRWCKESDSIVNTLVCESNLRHHKYPIYTVTLNYWRRNGSSILATLPFVIFFWYIDWYLLMTAFFFLGQSNEIHAWSHKKANGLIRFGQKIGLFCSPQQHHKHHKPPYDKYYCVISGWVNPVLEKIKFWHFMLWFHKKFFGMVPRKEREIF